MDNLFHLFHVPLLLRDETNDKLYPGKTREDFLNLSKALQLLEELKLVIFFLQVFSFSFFLGGEAFGEWLQKESEDSCPRITEH